MLIRTFFTSAALLAASFLAPPAALASADDSRDGAGRAASGTAADAVAMVTDRQGRVQMTDNGRARPVALLDYLRAGTELKLSGGATVTLVYFATGTQYTLTGEGGARMQADQPAVSGKVKLASNAMRQGALVVNARKETAQGALVMKSVPQPIQPLSPAESRVLDARPSFTWKSPKAKPPYRFALTDAGKQVVIEGTVKTAQFELPPGIKLVEGARYTWHVEGKTAKGEVLVGETSFDVATAAEREQVSRARPAAGAAFSERVTYATILDGMGFRDEARKEWRKLAAERKGDIRLRVRANKEH